MLKVAKEKCDQCLFSLNKIVSDARRKEVLENCKRRDCHFICHKTKDVCCRGFYDTQTSNLIRVMGRIGGIEFVEVKKP